MHVSFEMKARRGYLEEGFDEVKGRRGIRRREGASRGFDEIRRESSEGASTDPTGEEITAVNSGGDLRLVPRTRVSGFGLDVFS